MLNIKSSLRNYSVDFSQDFESLCHITQGDHTVCIIDRIVADLYREQLALSLDPQKTYYIDAKEVNKCIEYCYEVYEFLLRSSAKRNLHAVVIGGGITQDIAGFVASTLYRGINWTFYPTTLLAQTDSCIGSKTSLNFRNYKNLLGTFYPPNKVIINTAFTKTLSAVDFASGVGEVIKLQLMAALWSDDHLKVVAHKVAQCHQGGAPLEAVIKENLAVKSPYIEEDEFDLGRRNMLNYGHCFGHVIESVSHYRIPHGIGVVIGMLFANQLAATRGVLPTALHQTVASAVLLPNIPDNCKDINYSQDNIVDGFKSDKKRIGLLYTVIIPNSTGELMKVTDVTPDEVVHTYRAVKQMLLAGA